MRSCRRRHTAGKDAVRSIKFSLDVTTEVIDAHQELVTHSYADEAEKRLVVEMDVRRAKWRKTLGLGHRTQIHWADVRTVDIKELSSFGCAIVYRLTYGDGWYRGKDGKREYFALQPHLVGIDLCRQCTTVAVRASILLAVMGGIGLRGVCWLMQMLFHLEVSKSALDRWVKECAAQLPGAAEMAKVLNSDKRVTEGHFDEIFAKGQRPKRCTLVLRDEHGRIFAAQEIDSRDEKTVTAFLKEVKGWGIAPKRFFVDGCEAYRKAIGIVFSDAVIQYDYFHVIQGIFKKLRRAFVSHRRDVKKRSEEVGTPWYAAKLEALAKKLWDKRGLIFKNPDKMTPEEQAELLALMDEDSFVDTLRHFMDRVWGIFRDSKGQLGARQRLGRLKQHEEVQRDSKSAFAKTVAFLEDRFDDMTAFLRHPGVKRNSLAETGIRSLRRLERGHDGFRGPDGLQRYLRIYQAIKYCHWPVHRCDGGARPLGLTGADPPPTATTAAPVAG
jgi:hypothetical protein